MKFYQKYDTIIEKARNRRKFGLINSSNDNTNYFYEKNADEPNYFNFHEAYGNVMQAHFHRNMELLFVKEGQMKATINGEEHVLKQGDIAVVNSYDVHHYEGEKQSHVYVVLFGESLKPAELKSGEGLENFLGASPNADFIFCCLELFLKNMKKWNVLSCEGFVHLIIGWLVSEYGLRKRKSNVDTSLFMEVLKYIDEHFAEDITLEQLANKFGYTKNYFSMLFNKYLGKHLRVYLNELRVEKVEKRRAENKDSTVTALAMSCGFKSMNTYYRAVQQIKNRNF